MNLNKIKIYRIIRSYWYIPIVGIGLLLLYSIIPKALKRKELLHKLAVELEIAKAASQIRKLEATLGRDQAINYAVAQYETAKQELSKEKQTQAEKLRNNPVELSKFLVSALNQK